MTVPDWVGGAAVRLVGDDVILRSDIWNEVRLPLEQVSGIVFAQQSRPDEREGFVERVRGNAPRTGPTWVSRCRKWRGHAHEW